MIRLDVVRTPTREPAVMAGMGLFLLSLLAMARWFPWGTVPPWCFFLRFTGWPCPACGMTRSWIALARGDVAAALAWNPLGVLLFVATAVGGMWALLRALRLAPSFALSGQGRSWLALRVGVVLLALANWALVAMLHRVAP